MAASLIRSRLGSALVQFHGLNYPAASCVVKYHFPGHMRSSSNKVLPISVCRSYSFMSGQDLERLWASVTTVSNPGQKKGRAKKLKKKVPLYSSKRLIDPPEKYGKIPDGINPPPKVLERAKELQKNREGGERRKKEKPEPLQRGYTGSVLTGCRLGPPPPNGEYTFEGFDSILIELKRVSNMTKTLGRKSRISAFVVVGNHNGLIASNILPFFAPKPDVFIYISGDTTISNFAESEPCFGKGSGPVMAAAIKSAQVKASKSLQFVEVYENHTVYHNFKTSEMETKLLVSRKEKDYGLKCHRVIQSICQLVGIKDIHVKLEGSNNCQKIVKAFVKGLREQENHQALADRLNLHVLEYRRENVGIPKLIASPNGEALKEKDSNEELYNYDSLYFNGKIPLAPKATKPFYYNYYGFRKRCKALHMMRNQKEAQIIRNVYGLEPSREEMKTRQSKEE